MSMSGCAAFEMAFKCIVHWLLFILAEWLFLSCFFHMSVLRHKLINNSYLKLKRVAYSVKSTHANICLPPIRLYSSHRNATCLHLRPYVCSASLSLCHHHLHSSETFYLQPQLTTSIRLWGDETVTGARQARCLFTEQPLEEAPSVTQVSLNISRCWACSWACNGVCALRVCLRTCVFLSPPLRGCEQTSYLFVYLVQNKAMRQVSLELQKQLNQHWGSVVTHGGVHI